MGAGEGKRGHLPPPLLEGQYSMFFYDILCIVDISLGDHVNEINLIIQFPPLNWITDNRISRIL